MEPEYYRVRKKERPEENGIVVKVTEKGMQNLTGDSKVLADYSCHFSKKGSFSVGEDFYSDRITKRTALDLEDDYWRHVHYNVKSSEQIVRSSAVKGDPRI